MTTKISYAELEAVFPWVRFLPKAALCRFMVIIDDYHAAADIYKRKPAA